MTRTKTYIVRKRIEATSWDCMKRALARMNGWKADTVVYSYLESLDACSLEALQFEAVVEPAVPFEGRLFDGNVEAWWRLLHGGKWVAWNILEGGSEQPGDDQVGEPVYRIDRRYYLRGFLDEDQGQFREARYPDSRFVYPVQPVQATRRARAYIEVVEYWRTEPDWDEHDDDHARRTLALPLLCAHRFCGVRAGTDESRDGGGDGDRQG